MLTIQMLSRAAIGLLILFSLAFPVEAQTVKRVTFKKGQNSIVFKGKLPLEHGDYQAYVCAPAKIKLWP